jgi:hypothetical protein
MPKKKPPEERYSPKRFEINEKDIVDGEYEDMGPREKQLLFVTQRRRNPYGTYQSPTSTSSR